MLLVLKTQLEKGLGICHEKVSVNVGAWHCFIQQGAVFLFDQVLVLLVAASQITPYWT